MAYIEEFCDSIAILSAGKVAISGDLPEIKRNYVRDKLAVSTTNPERIKSDSASPAPNARTARC